MVSANAPHLHPVRTPGDLRGDVGVVMVRTKIKMAKRQAQGKSRVIVQHTLTVPKHVAEAFPPGSVFLCGREGDCILYVLEKQK